MPPSKYVPGEILNLPLMKKDLMDGQQGQIPTRVPAPDIIGGITNKLNLGLICRFEKLGLGFELLMFYYV